MSDDQVTDDTDDREEVLARFSRATGIPSLTRVTQRGRDLDTARYTLHLDDGRQIRIGTLDRLWSRTEMAKLMLATCGIIVTRCKAADWQDAISVLIARGVDVEEITGEAFEDSVREWLDSYLATHPPSQDRAGAATQQLPFTEGDQVHVAASHLAKYIRREYSENVQLRPLREALSDLGLQRQTIYYEKRSGKRTSASYYVGALEDSDTNTGA
jgi:hypothetical protein